MVPWKYPSVLLTLCNLGIFCLQTFFKNIYLKFRSETLPESQTFGSRSALIWVRTNCKGYQQTTKVAASKEIVNKIGQTIWKSVDNIDEFGEVWFVVGRHIASLSLIYPDRNILK